MEQTTPVAQKSRRSFFATIASAFAGGVAVTELLPRLFRRGSATVSRDDQAPAVMMHPEAVARTNKGVKHG